MSDPQSSFAVNAARRLRTLPRKLCRKLGLQKLLYLFLSKGHAELRFQRDWVRQFSAQPEKTREYWEKYRCFSDVLRLCAMSSRSKALDVGCGISTVLHFLPGERHGIDPLADEYHKLYRYPDGMSVISASGEDIPFPDASFDVAFCSNVLDHVSDPRQVMTEMARVLKPGGHFVLTLELFDSDAKGKRDPAHPYQFSRQGAVDLVSPWFTVEHEDTSPCISLAMYYANKLPPHTREELILICERRGGPVSADSS